MSGEKRASGSLLEAARFMRWLRGLGLGGTDLPADAAGSVAGVVPGAEAELLFAPPFTATGVLENKVAWLETALDEAERERDELKEWVAERGALLHTHGQFETNRLRAERAEERLVSANLRLRASCDALEHAANWIERVFSDEPVHLAEEEWLDVRRRLLLAAGGDFAEFMRAEESL